ncbi:hypothetical protein E2C01_064168 [Portunus trituberculatus]|uniref:Uncharacterized protein n=1 Tax=Portunus trituberculatus TaxID=210409 RepID=A0A5B7HK32_PORTR|nr:hypothetical protein [Portunus trituberculatus]
MTSFYSSDLVPYVLFPTKFISSVTHSLHLFFGLPTICQPPTLTSSTSLITLPSTILHQLWHLTAGPPILQPHSCHVSQHPVVTAT